VVSASQRPSTKEPFTDPLTFESEAPPSASGWQVKTYRVQNSASDGTQDHHFSVMSNDKLSKLLECPTCHGAELFGSPDVRADLTCPGCGQTYPMLRGVPVLVSANNRVFDRGAYQEGRKRGDPPSDHGWLSRLAQALTWRLNAWAPPRSINLARARMIKLLASRIGGDFGGRILVVGGGTQRLDLEAEFAQGGNCPQMTYVDIDVNADVDFFADAHDLPFKANTFDAVITTAVLEHVLYPERVSDEIYRVVKVGGLLYSELPFMQQVHEGAYDFTRFTLSGHRRLFNGFKEIESGMVSGPGTALVWSIESFALCFFRRPLARALMRFTLRAGLGWLRLTDRALANRPSALDSASCTYFFGGKVTDRVSDEEIVASYRGAGTMTHT
jgi:SAM-dependent methyltransferase